MIVPLLCLLLAAPAPKNKAPSVEIVVRIVTAPDAVTADCGLDERLDEGAAVLTERELVRLLEVTQRRRESNVLQMPATHLRIAEVMSVTRDRHRFTVEPRATKGKAVTVQLRREAAKGRARVNREAELLVGETLLVRQGKSLIAVSCEKVDR